MSTLVCQIHTQPWVHSETMFGSEAIYKQSNVNTHNPVNMGAYLYLPIARRRIPSLASKLARPQSYFLKHVQRGNLNIDLESGLILLLGEKKRKTGSGEQQN